MRPQALPGITAYAVFLLNIFPMIAKGCHEKKKIQKMEWLPQQAFYFLEMQGKYSITIKCGFL
jgi:hypothetical protein